MGLVQDDDRPDAYDCFPCAAGGAIRAFSQSRFDAMAAKLVHHLRRVSATGIYGGEIPHRTLWDEYCHEAQYGLGDPEIEQGWRETLSPFLANAIARVTQEEAVLLTIGAVWELDQEDQFGPLGARCDDLIRECLEHTLRVIAGARDLSRFSPTY